MLHVSENELEAVKVYSYLTNVKRGAEVVGARPFHSSVTLRAAVSLAINKSVTYVDNNVASSLSPSLSCTLSHCSGSL